MAERVRVADAGRPLTLRVGSRGSALALRQAAIVIEAIGRIDPSIICPLEVIRTPADDAPDVAPASFGVPGVFVRGLDTALLGGSIDVAVHSAKDLPSAEMAGLAVAAFLAREDPRDALVARSGARLAELPAGATVGTGSPRRRALLLDARPDLQVRPIRGNVDTRLRRVADGDLHAVVVAAAGLARLGRLAEASELLDPTSFVPAPGQGILALQVRDAAEGSAAVLRLLDDASTRACAAAERAVATSVSAGCQTPVGAYARVEAGRMVLDAFVLARDERSLIRAHEEGDPSCPLDLGFTAGARLGRAAPS